MGPIPQPETLGGYEEIVPGAGDRIIAMAESQLAHRQAQDLERLRQESVRLEADIKLEGLGQKMAFVVAMTALVGGIGLLAFDKSVAGLATTIGALVGVIGVFISSRWKARRPAQFESTNPTDTE